ncbi:gastrula zinc finger protein XlCGF57.1-like isoform X2 [Conger conger]|nr:gastrula zinc finger protein XlCGF57.1-like isoform X2 [Conger conger]
MDALAKTAAAEITKLVDDGSAVWRLEMSRSQRENEALKAKLLLMEGELRAVRGYGEGTPDNSLKLSFEVPVCDEFTEAQIHTSGAAAANNGEGPLCKEEELHMQPCPAGDPEKELQAELKQEPEEQPLTPTLPLLESADWGMELQTVWSKANSLEISLEKNRQCIGSLELVDARLDDDFSPPHYTARRPRSEKGEGSASQQQKQNGRPLYNECSYGLPDEVSAELAFPLGSPGECDGSALCEASSDTSAEAKSPCRTEGQEEEFICTRCGKTFPDALELKAHEEQHSAGKQFSFSVCDQSFSQSHVLQAHKSTHTGRYVCTKYRKAYQLVHTREKSHCCKECGKSFNRLGNLKTHQRVHTKEKPFTCELCGKCFSLKGHLKSHQVIHTGEKCFSCTVCNKSFAYLSVLKQHQRIHTGEKPHCCNECGKSFNRLGSLKSHQSVHTKEKPFTCEQCGKCFFLKSQLKTHQVTHTGEKCFSCTVCNKSFYKLSLLVSHQRVHTGEKPFSCEQCGRCFSQKSHLKTHQVIHTGEKCFSCTVCNKSFAYLSALKQHQRIHTGEKLHCCNECGKSFTRRSNLKTHERVHTRGNTIQLHTVQQEFLPESHSSETRTFSQSGLQTNNVPGTINNVFGIN